MHPTHALWLSALQRASDPIGNATTVSNVSSSACPTQQGAHIIVARASLEPAGYGIIGQVKDQVLARVPGSTAEFVDYPATLNDYINSESDGVIAMRQLINNYVANCTGKAPLVIMGYSQGAQVTADTLVGQQDGGFPDNSTIDQPLSSSVLSRVAAAVMMGDPTFVTNETFHVGNATKNGDFPRKDVSNFDITGLAKRTKSYCDSGDPYCAGGNFSTLSVHLGYVQEYGAAAEDFIVNQIKSYYAGNGTTATNGTSSGNGTSSTNGTSTGGSPSSTSSGSGYGSSSKTSSTAAASTGGASSIPAFSMLSSILSAGALAWMFL